MTHKCLQCTVGVVKHVIIPAHDTWLKKDKQSRATELEVSKLLSSLDVFSRLASDDSAADHHSAYADDHDPAMLLRVDGHQNSHIFAVNIEGRSNGHRVDSVVFAFDKLGLAHDTIHWDVEAMVVLRRKAENAESTTLVPLRVFRVAAGQKTFHSKVSSFYPNRLSSIKCVEDNTATICWRHDDLRPIWCRARSRFRLQRSIEEFVEVLKLFDWMKDLRHVKLVESDEARDLSS